MRAADAAPAGTARHQQRTVRLGESVSLPVRPMPLLTGCALLALLVAVSVVTLSAGDLGIALLDLPGVVTGAGQGTDAFVWDRLRGPRLVVGLGAGAAFGLSGALFQSVTRNPLGSPDVIGLGAGAGAGAAIVAMLLPDVVPASVGALLGAVVAMAVVYVSTGSGFRNPVRLIVAGIGVSAMAVAVIQFVVYTVERDKALVLSAYVNGSLTARSWDEAVTIWLVALVVIPASVLVARDLRIGEMGDDLATSLGGRPERTKTAAVVLAIVLSAGAVSVAGPIAFISLTAPQIVRRICRGPGPRVLLSTLMGALLLACADLAAQQMPGDDLPVGVYTMALGGAYLGYLLIREWRKGNL